MAAGAVLAETYPGGGTGRIRAILGRTTRAAAIGTPAMQGLVHSLDTISGFLLIGPLIGSIAGAVLASFGKPKRD